MSETVEVLLAVAGMMVVAAVVVGWMVLSGRKPNLALDARVAELTPSQTLVEAVVAPGAFVELRARAAQGAHKVWLDCDASPTERWSAIATLVHRISPAGSGYRGAEAGAAAEGRIAFGEDGDGISVTGEVAVPRTGALGIPRDGRRYWLQLATLPACPEGSELFVRVGVSDLKGGQPSAFRAFIGVSVA